MTDNIENNELTGDAEISEAGEMVSAVNEENKTEAIKAEETKAFGNSDKKKNNKGMIKNATIFVLSAALLAESLALVNYSNSFANTANAATESEDSTITKIDRAEFDELVASKESFIVMFGRISCKQCAVVEYVLDEIKDSPVKIYLFDMEQYYGSDEYDLIKGDVGFSYVPTFFYYENGVKKYCMNNPLPDGYYDDNQSGEGRHALRVTTRENIQAFIDGITGNGDVVNEEPTSDVITGKQVLEQSTIGN